MFGFGHSADEVTENFTPYQLILGTLTLVYALRHVSDIFGLGGEKPQCIYLRMLT